MKTRLMAALFLGAFALAGCGGGGGGGGDTTTSMPDPAGSPLSFAGLVQGQIVQPGTYHLTGAADAFLAALETEEIPVGGVITIAGLSFRCTGDNTSNCNIAVHKDGSFTTVGTIATVLFGGEFPMTQAERIEEAIARATRRAEEAEQRAEQAEEEKQAAEERIAKAEREAQEAQEEAERRIAEAETQTNLAVRAPLLITELSGLAASDVATGAGVRYVPGESRTFTRPLGIPAEGSAPSVPGSWHSASYSGPRGTAGTDTVYLYTNIQAPSSKAFWKVHGEEVTSITATEATVSGFGTTAKELYPASDGTLDGATTTSGADTARSIGGTYDGYSGTFKCEAECDIAAADDGALTFHGTWTFTASLTAKRQSKYAVQDTEFLYFGIWALDPTNAATAPDFKWAAGGDSNDGAAAIGNFADLTGTATFTGGAIGKYALAKVGGRAAKIGTFTAAAAFTADFDRAPDDSAGSRISGWITDFKEGGSDLGSDWRVFLGSSDSAAATLGAGSATGTLEAHGAIDGDTATGVWAATLHGSDNPGAALLRTADADKYPASRYPVADVAGVSGWFRASAGTNAAIAGAFGAACTTGTMCAR